MEASTKPLIAWFLPERTPRTEFVIRTLCTEWLGIPYWIGTPADTPPYTPYRIACGCNCARLFISPSILSLRGRVVRLSFAGLG